MNWTIKYPDNTKIKFGVKYNSDMSIDFIGYYNVRGNWVEIKKISFPYNGDIYKLTVESVTDVLMELLQYLLEFELNLKKINDFFEDFASIELMD